MKRFKLTILLLSGLIIIKSQNIAAQNLQFNQAIFNTYGPGNPDANQSTPMFTGSLVVGANQVLKITSATCASINASLSGSGSIPFVGILTINDFHYQLAGLYQTEIWLPTGTYSIKGFESSPSVTGGSFKGLISGVLYDIVP